MTVFQGRIMKKTQFNQADEFEFEIVLIRGKLQLRRVTFSNYIPLENITDDNVRISIAEMKWFPKSIPKKGKLSLNNGDINFSRKMHERKLQGTINNTPEKIKRRQCITSYHKCIRNNCYCWKRNSDHCWNQT